MITEKTPGEVSGANDCSPADVTPRGAANMFMFLRPGKREEDRSYLATLITEYARDGYLRGLQEAKKRYREFHSGGCRMLSQGEECECFLCEIDKLCGQIRQ